MMMQELEVGSLARGGPDTAVVLSAELQDWLSSALQQCGCSVDASQGVVPMMRMIEAKLDECLSEAALIPTTFVDEWEKSREKERRQVLTCNHNL